MPNCWSKGSTFPLLPPTLRLQMLITRQNRTRLRRLGPSFIRSREFAHTTFWFDSCYSLPYLLLVSCLVACLGLESLFFTNLSSRKGRLFREELTGRLWFVRTRSPDRPIVEWNTSVLPNWMLFLAKLTLLLDWSAALSRFGRTCVLNRNLVFIERFDELPPWKISKSWRFER